MVRVTLLPSVSTGKKTKGPKRVDTELIAKLDKHFQRWLQLAGYGLEIPLDQYLRHTDESRTDKWIKIAALRYSLGHVLYFLELTMSNVLSTD